MKAFVIPVEFTKTDWMTFKQTSNKVVRYKDSCCCWSKRSWTKKRKIQRLNKNKTENAQDGWFLLVLKKESVFGKIQVSQNDNDNEEEKKWVDRMEWTKVKMKSNFKFLILK